MEHYLVLIEWCKPDSIYLGECFAIFSGIYLRFISGNASKAASGSVVSIDSYTHPRHFQHIEHYYITIR